MNDLTFIQLRRGHEEDGRRFESLMVPYFRELDRHQGRHTDPEFLRKRNAQHPEHAGAS